MKILSGNLFRALAIFGAIVVLTSCSGGNSAIIGKWSESNGAVTEFRSDGTCNVGEYAGKFHAGSDHVTVDLDGPIGKVVGKFECKISAVTPNSFDLTYPDNEVHHLKKVQ